MFKVAAAAAVAEAETAATTECSAAEHNSFER